MKNFMLVHSYFLEKLYCGNRAQKSTIHKSLRPPGTLIENRNPCLYENETIFSLSVGYGLITSPSLFVCKLRIYIVKGLSQLYRVKKIMFDYIQEYVDMVYLSG